MTEAVKSIREDADLLQVKEIFDLNEFHHLPVLNAERKVVGIISRLDFNLVCDQFTIFKLKRAEVENKEFLSTVLVEDIMTRQVAAIGPTDSVDEAVKIFLGNSFHCLPVVESDKLVGIVTTHDLLKYYSMLGKTLNLTEA